MWWGGIRARDVGLRNQALGGNAEESDQGIIWSHTLDRLEGSADFHLNLRLNTIVCGLNIVLVEHRVAPLAILAQFSQDGFRKHPGLISRK